MNEVFAQACPNAPDGRHDLELVPAEKGTFKARCRHCSSWLSKDGLDELLEESKETRRYTAH